MDNIDDYQSARSSKRRLHPFKLSKAPNRQGISKLTGKPVIHFAHANGMPSRVYAPIFDRLTNDFTVVFIPILGRSDPINSEWHKDSNQKTGGVDKENYHTVATNINPNHSQSSSEPKYPIDNHWQSLTQQIIDSVKLTCERHEIDSVIGLGHSLGALCTLQAIYRRPHLFSQAVLMDPPLIYGYASFLWHLAKLTSETLVYKMTPAGISQRRRDSWQSCDQAYSSLRDKTFFKAFDERCFDNYIKFGLTDSKNISPNTGAAPYCKSASPTLVNDGLGDAIEDNEVTLTIPKEIEVAVFTTNPSLYWIAPNKAPKVPVTLLIGMDSPFYKRGFVHKVQQRLSIPFKLHQGGHMFPLEHPDSVANTIRELLL